MTIDKWGFSMREVINSVTTTSGGATFAGAVTGDMMVGIAGLVLMAIFGVWGGWLRYRDSKALRRALEAGDIKEAIKIRSK